MSEEGNLPAVVAEVQGWLTESWPTLADHIPKHVNRERLKRIMLDQVRNNGSIRKCSPDSIFRACVKAANLGLEVGMLNSAWLVPFKGTCTLVPGYNGLIQLGHNSGSLKAVNVYEVRANDAVTLDGSGEIQAKINPFATDRGEMIGVVCVLTLRDGSRQYTTMGEAEYHKTRPAHWPETPHATHPIEMWKKAAIRRALKTVPLTPEISEVIADADRAEYDESAVVQVKPSGRGTKAVREILMPTGETATMESIDITVMEMPAAEPEPEPRRPRYLRWEDDLAAANRLIALMGTGIPKWDKMTEARKALVYARMKAEGFEDHGKFWARATEVLTPFDSRLIETWSTRSLEVFLRLPQRGNPDHWQLAAEGHYRPGSMTGEGVSGDDREPEFDPLA